MATKREVFQCDLCGHFFEGEAGAKACESTHLNFIDLKLVDMQHDFEPGPQSLATLFPKKIVVMGLKAVYFGRDRPECEYVRGGARFSIRDEEGKLP